MAHDLRGNEGTITYSGNDSPVVADVTFWTMRMWRERTRVTRPGYRAPRYSYGPLNVDGVIRFPVSNANATNPLPLGIAADLVLYEDTTNSPISGETQQSYAFKASLYELRKLGVDSAGSGQQWAEYAFTIDAQAAAALASTITVV